MRFVETLSTGIVTDTVTGKEYKCDVRIDDELLKLMNDLHDENEQLRKDATTLIYANKDYREEIKFLKNKVETYKTGNRLLKERYWEKK